MLSFTHVRTTGTLTLHTGALSRRNTTRDGFDGAEELLVAAVVADMTLMERNRASVWKMPFVAVVAQRPELMHISMDRGREKENSELLT